MVSEMVQTEAVYTSARNVYSRCHNIIAPSDRPASAIFERRPMLPEILLQGVVVIEQHSLACISALLCQTCIMAGSVKQEGTVIMNEPILNNIHKEDQTLVRNVLYACKACILSSTNVLDNWAITVQDTSYIIRVYFRLEGGFDVNVRDMQAVYEVSPLRVQSVSVGKTESGPVTLQIVVANKVCIALTLHFFDT